MHRVGLDINGSRVCLARVSNDLGRPIVERLEEIELATVSGREWWPDSQPVFGIDDRLAQVKHIQLKLNSNIGYSAAGKFELARTLLEPESEFLFATYPTKLENGYVGTICRIDELNRLIDRVGLAPRIGFDSSVFVLRSAALGSGYLTYCQTASGELTGLIDLREPSASICLVYNGRIISLAHMPVDKPEGNDLTSYKKIAVQGKTVINLLTSRLSGLGLNLPVATLILTGDLADEIMFEQFAARFSMGVARPKLNEAYLSESLKDQSGTERFLVAMGLAFNSLAP
jgi:hypothetical protein